MENIIIILIGFIIIEHFIFLYLEMFLWTKKSGRKIFANSIEDANTTKILAANQGLYNGFLAMGLLFGIFYLHTDVKYDIILFFLCCILIAGVFGGLTAKKSILYIQALPAFITIIMIYIL